MLNYLYQNLYMWIQIWIGASVYDIQTSILTDRHGDFCGFDFRLSCGDPKAAAAAAATVAARIGRATRRHALRFAANQLLARRPAPVCADSA